MARVEHIGDATLILGDCREVLPTLGPVDAVVTDPPYGIGITKSNRLSLSRGFTADAWDDAPISAEDIGLLMAAGHEHIIWGGNYFDLPPTRCFLVWDKLNEGRDFADIEQAWTDLDAVARVFRMRPMNMDGGKEHPTQKPVELMKWCLDKLTSKGPVVDPFMGSGSTGVACAKRGRRFFGIEVDQRHFETACRRIDEAYRQADLFVEAPAPKPVQTNLLDDPDWQRKDYAASCDFGNAVIRARNSGAGR